MSIALTRSDLIAYQNALPKHARGRRQIERLVKNVTCDELRFEIELETALRDGIASDPETFADKFSGALGGGA